MTNFIDSIRAEYLRHKALAEAAIDQLPSDARNLIAFWTRRAITAAAAATVELEYHWSMSGS